MEGVQGRTTAPAGGRDLGECGTYQTYLGIFICDVGLEI